MSKEYTAKKYFINGFKQYIKNENKALSKLYMPSLRELLIEYIEIHEDITTNLELDKLGNARNEHIEAMIYYIKNNILYERSVYKKELSFLIQQLETLSDKSDKEKLLHYSKIFTLCISLIKKFDTNNIYRQIVDLVKTYSNFSQSENAIHFIINELLYDGYSLKYLDSWYNEQIAKEKIEESNIDNVLDLFCKLKQDNKKFTYFINVLDNKYFENEKLYIDFNLNLLKKDYNQLTLIDSKSNQETKKYLQQTKGYNICSIEISAKDYYKGLDNILNSINSYFQMIHYVSSPDESLFLEKIVCEIHDGTYKKLRLKENEMPNDTEILFGNTENRERQDVEDFIRYREQVFTESINSQEVFNIQRALNIIKNQVNQSQENKIINLWAVLEYLLTFKESGGSIISKVKDVVPKVVCLYYLKDKINVFWNRIYEHRDKKIPIIDEFLKCKKQGEIYQYDLDKLIEFISNKGPNLITELEFSLALSRDIAEIGLFLNNPKKLAEQISVKNQEIKHDLVRIYRARNMLIHSGKETKANLSCRSLRLYKYNNNLIGLIIYYMCKNPHFKISEILNSIDYTYENYIHELKEGASLETDIIKPKYLFIS
ncbi:hypothetical protein [Neobacillus sp. DY30]|uniref:hypothetical protein n=1 Tax=Neobacillus sp. DY30 TaxID=3047871 RepID=UPI0024C0D61F|nr:hypothetical protein [Neobacillus sp. DY30]WHY01092.1 hypothetical protein QNH29_02170 [Neobacillus sp. DY30]